MDRSRMAPPPAPLPEHGASLKDVKHNLERLSCRFDYMLSTWKKDRSRLSDLEAARRPPAVPEPPRKPPGPINPFFLLLPHQAHVADSSLPLIWFAADHMLEAATGPAGAQRFVDVYLDRQTGGERFPSAAEPTGTKAQAHFVMTKLIYDSLVKMGVKSSREEREDLLLRQEAEGGHDAISIDLSGSESSADYDDLGDESGQTDRAQLEGKGEEEEEEEGEEDEDADDGQDGEVGKSFEVEEDERKVGRSGQTAEVEHAEGDPTQDNHEDAPDLPPDPQHGLLGPRPGSTVVSTGPLRTPDPGIRSLSSSSRAPDTPLAQQPPAPSLPQRSTSLPIHSRSLLNYVRSSKLMGVAAAGGTLSAPEVSFHFTPFPGDAGESGSGEDARARTLREERQVERRPSKGEAIARLRRGQVFV